VAVRLELWNEGDLPLLRKLMGDPAMMEYLGGRESDEEIAARQARYERPADSSKSNMFKIVDIATGVAVGSVGYWEKLWRPRQIYEIGWSVLPAFQGRGIATKAAAEAIALAGSQKTHQFLHAFPNVENRASNAICRSLGFTLIEECQFEYPRGSFMCCGSWRLDLFAGR
jgi:RimJ/RimL family protein N-acetyltransferase